MSAFQHRLRSTGLTSLLVLGCALSPDPGVELRTHPWWEVRGSLFSIRGNTDPEDLSHLAHDLELFIEVVRAVSDFRLDTPRYDLHIYVPRDPRLVDVVYGRGFLGVHTDSTRRGNLVLMKNLDSKAQTRAVLYHEFVHFLLSQSRQYRPRWYHEGLAELLSSVYRREELVSVGHVPGMRAHILHWPERSSVREILDAHDYRVGDFYEMSWLLVHFLHAGRGAGGENRRLQGVAFLDDLEEGKPWEPAFEERFGFAPEVLDEELEAHRELLRSGILRLIQLRADQLGAATPEEPSPLPESAVAADLSELLIRNRRSQFAVPLLRDSLASHPGDPLLLACLAWAQTLSGQSGEAGSHLRQAVASGSEDPRVWLCAGRAQGVLSQKDDDREQGLERARAHFRRAAELDEDLPAAWAELGLSYAVEGSQASPGPGIAALERALDLRPADVEAHLALGKLRLREGKPELARSHLQLVDRWSRVPKLREEALELLAELD